MMRYIRLVMVVFALLTTTACKKYLDIVPDNVATIEYAFRMRTTAEQFLFTCYSYLPDYGNKYASLALYGADEFWLSNDKTTWNTWNVALGLQNVNSPLVDYWNGANGATDLWEAINQCNVFLENIEGVPDMESYERVQWAAEVKFLKAYYHFLLLKSYGPIPIIDANFPISASGDEVRVERRAVDEVFAYIDGLIDEAMVDLPTELMNEPVEYGRITQPIALGIKAKILVFAASPLFNGNTDYNGFTSHDGTPLFNTTYDPEKWRKAVVVLKEAIDLAHSIGHQLYEFEYTLQTRDISDTTKLQLTTRGIVTERWNDEILWSHTGSTTKSLQEWIAPKALSSAQTAYSVPNGSTGVPLKIAAKFYTDKGVPIDEDRTWPYSTRFDLQEIGEEERYNLKMGDTTIKFNFHRENRFYGSLGFDRGIWYGQGEFDDKDTYSLELKVTEFGGKVQAGWHSVTGYYAKKLIHYTNTNSANNTYVAISYPWVMLRLGDLYLLYAEALNEVNGPTPETYKYLDRIRARAGLEGVLESWQNYSNRPSKPTTQDGLREIIHRERTIEMAFEGQRFWDLRRWKTAMEELNQAITGLDVDQETTEAFNRQRVIFDQTFSLKDYFTPLRENDLIVNKNLVQNPGW